MDTIEAMLARHSVRDFKKDGVPRDTVVKILEAATRSASSGNSQPWQIFAAGGDVLEKIRQTYSDRFRKEVPGKPEFPSTPLPQWTEAMRERMSTQRLERFKLQGIDPQDGAAVRASMEMGARLFNAPVVLVLCMDRGLMPGSGLDIGLLSTNIMLATQNMGLGSIIATGLVTHPDVLRQELGIPDSLQIVTGIAIGYQNDDAVINRYRSSRRPVSEVVTFKGF